MKKIRVISGLLVLCLAFSGVAFGETVGATNKGIPVMQILFDVTFRHVAEKSELKDFGYMFTFESMYSDGFWVTSYALNFTTYFMVKATRPGPAGEVCSVEIISDEENDQLFREICAYAAAALTMSYPDNIYKLLAGGVELTEIMEVLDIEESGYAFQTRVDGAVRRATLTTTQPYEVEGYSAVPIQRDVEYFLPEGTMDLETFIGCYEDALIQYYGMSEDTVEALAPWQAEDNIWIHTYGVAGAAIVCVVTEGEGMDSPVKFLYVMDNVDDPITLVAMGAAAFGALAGFDAEQHAVMGVLAGAHTTFEECVAFLPVVAYNNMMLMYGVQETPISSETSVAYIVGTP